MTPPAPLTRRDFLCTGLASGTAVLGCAGAPRSSDPVEPERCSGCLFSREGRVTLRASARRSAWRTHEEWAHETPYTHQRTGRPRQRLERTGFWPVSTVPPGIRYCSRTRSSGPTQRRCRAARKRPSCRVRWTRTSRSRSAPSSRTGASSPHIGIQARSTSPCYRVRSISASEARSTRPS